MNDLMMRTAMAHLRVHKGDLVRSFVFDTIVSTNLENNSLAMLEAELNGTDGDPVVRRPVSAHAIAQSLGMPYETVRGRVMTLIRLGLCERHKGGLIVPAEVARRPEFEEATLKVHGAFVDVIRAMAELGFDFAGLAAKTRATPGRTWPAGEGPPPALVVRLVMDFQIRHLSHVAPDFGDIIRGLIWAGILQANVRDFLRSQDKAWTYARQSTPPPDELRVPISIRMLARELGIPYETVRRHVAALMEMNYLEAVPGKGVFVPAAALTTETLGSQNPRQMVQFTRLIGDLTRLGFDFLDPR